MQQSEGEERAGDKGQMWVFETDKNTSREMEEEGSVELSLIGMMGRVQQISAEPNFS